MKRRTRVTLALTFGVLAPAWLATAAAGYLWGADGAATGALSWADFDPFTGLLPRGWYAVAEIGVLVTLLGLLLGFILSRTVYRYSHNLQDSIRSIWESISGRSLFPDEKEDDVVGVARSMALEFSILRKTETDLKSKVIRLEHALRERERADVATEDEINNLVEIKTKSERVCAHLREQVRDLEDKIAKSRLVRGDTWFAALVREMLQPLAERDGEPEGEPAGPDTDCDTRRDVVQDLLALANLCRESVASALQPANLGEILEKALESMQSKQRVKFLLSPFASHVQTNPLALDLLLRRILLEVDRRDEDVTIRAWRQRSPKGQDRIRVAIEQHDRAMETLIDCVALHGLATLAGTVVKTERFDDDRIAQVIYFDAASSAQNNAQNTGSPRLQTALQTAVSPGRVASPTSAPDNSAGVEIAVASRNLKLIPVSINGPEHCTRTGT